MQVPPPQAGEKVEAGKPYTVQFDAYSSVDVVRRFDLADDLHPLSRCLECNVALEAVTAEEAIQPKAKKGGKFNTPTILCIIFSIFALLAIGLSFYLQNPYLILVGYFPAVVYEAMRTAGPYTKAASAGMVLLIILEALAIKGVIQFNLADFLGKETAYIKGYWLPLGEIVTVFPLITIVLAILLFQRTIGRYTKWLSVIILVSSVALLWQINKEALIDIVRTYLNYQL